MDWLTFGVQWLHVLLGILWFGNALTFAVIVIPALNQLSLPTQREFGGYIGRRAVPLFRVVAPTIVVLGFIRGTFLGPIDGIDDVFGTAYGITWLVALIAATLTFAWGEAVISPRLEAMNTSPLNADGTATTELEVAAARVKQAVVLELVGFVVIFTCMVLMRFGY